MSTPAGKQGYTPSISTAEAQDLMCRFSDSVYRFLDRAGKASQASGMFDMRRRTLIGVYTFFDNLPWVFDVLDRHATPEQIGLLGRGLCGQPFSAQIHGVLWAYLLSRENELGLGRDGGDPEQLIRVIEWWSRAAGAYRGTPDEALVPSEGDGGQPACDPELVAAVHAELGRPVAEFPEAAKATAALQLYNYVLRGEQRGTSYYHGPYPGPEGTSLIVEEFTRLRDNELIWSSRPPLLPFDRVCSILEIDAAVEFDFDMFQGMKTDPIDFRAHVRRTSLLTTDGGEARPIEAAEREQMMETLAAEQRRVFREQLTWDSEFKILYGAYHYLDFIAPFFSATGCDPELMEEARARFGETMRRRIGEVTEVEPIPVWERLFARSGRDLFTPLPGA